MSCSKYVQMISEVIDNELKEERELFLMRHLVVCDKCRLEYESSLKLREVMTGQKYFNSVEVPASFSTNVIRAIEAEALDKVAPVDVGGATSLANTSKLSRLIARPAVSWALAASLMLVVSVTFFSSSMKGGGVENPLMDARKLTPRVLSVKAVENDKGKEPEYYVNRHANAVYNKTFKTIRDRTGGGIMLATYNVR